MKPVKERLKIYLMIVAFGLVLIVAFLVSGYDYSKSKGFYVSEDREPMTFIEALGALPSELVWFSLAFAIVILVVEVFMVFFSLFKN
ncbi:MAG: hypothetical protein KTR16_03835 [Acidiferrobacterales bacterium]|nr:hypothetical protein [Acidiferrobacterales bacterium]